MFFSVPPNIPVSTAPIDLLSAFALKISVFLTFCTSGKALFVTMLAKNLCAISAFSDAFAAASLIANRVLYLISIDFW